MVKVWSTAASLLTVAQSPLGMLEQGKSLECMLEHDKKYGVLQPVFLLSLPPTCMRSDNSTICSS